MTPMNKQRGFTLVEIAIVLVIIGLLLGGILKGQELITSARVRNIADQNSGVQAAYYGFIDRYRQIPGDMTAALAIQAIGNSVPAGIGGNGDGRLNDDTLQETAAVWTHLSRAGFIQGNYLGCGATGTACAEAAYLSQTIAPINAFNGRVVLTRTDDYNNAGGAGSVRLAFITGNQIPVNVMRELDVKVDDGFPETGVLRSALDVGAALGVLAQGAAACITLSGGTEIWNIDGNDQNCNAVYLY